MDWGLMLFLLAPPARVDGVIKGYFLRGSELVLKVVPVCYPSEEKRPLLWCRALRPLWGEYFVRLKVKANDVERAEVLAPDGELLWRSEFFPPRNRFSIPASEGKWLPLPARRFLGLSVRLRLSDGGEVILKPEIRGASVQVDEVKTDWINLLELAEAKRIVKFKGEEILPGFQPPRAIYCLECADGAVLLLGQRGDIWRLSKMARTFVPEGRKGPFGEMLYLLRAPNLGRFFSAMSGAYMWTAVAKGLRTPVIFLPLEKGIEWSRAVLPGMREDIVMRVMSIIHEQCHAFLFKRGLKICLPKGLTGEKLQKILPLVVAEVKALNSAAETKGKEAKGELLKEALLIRYLRLKRMGVSPEGLRALGTGIGAHELLATYVGAMALAKAREGYKPLPHLSLLVPAFKGWEKEVQVEKVKGKAAPEVTIKITPKATDEAFLEALGARSDLEVWETVTALLYLRVAWELGIEVEEQMRQFLQGKTPASVVAGAIGFKPPADPEREEATLRAVRRWSPSKEALERVMPKSLPKGPKLRAKVYLPVGPGYVAEALPLVRRGTSVNFGRLGFKFQPSEGGPFLLAARGSGAGTLIEVEAPIPPNSEIWVGRRRAEVKVICGRNGPRLWVWHGNIKCWKGTIEVEGRGEFLPATPPERPMEWTRLKPSELRKGVFDKALWVSAEIEGVFGEGGFTPLLRAGLMTPGEALSALSEVSGTANIVRFRRISLLPGGLKRIWPSANKGKFVVRVSARGPKVPPLRVIKAPEEGRGLIWTRPRLLKSRPGLKRWEFEVLNVDLPPEWSIAIGSIGTSKLRLDFGEAGRFDLPLPTFMFPAEARIPFEVRRSFGFRIGSEPVPGAKVRLMAEERGLAEATADEKGKGALLFPLWRLLDAGSPYRLRVVAEGSHRLRGFASLVSPWPIKVNLMPDWPSIPGKVVVRDEKGNVFPGAAKDVVVSVKDERGRTVFGPARPDRRGEFETGPLKPGKYVVEARISSLGLKRSVHVEIVKGQRAPAPLVVVEFVVRRPLAHWGKAVPCGDLTVSVGWSRDLPVVVWVGEGSPPRGYSPYVFPHVLLGHGVWPEVEVFDEEGRLVLRRWAAEWATGVKNVARFPALPAGTYTVKAKARFYEPAERRVIVKPKAKTNVWLPLPFNFLTIQGEAVVLDERGREIPQAGREVTFRVIDGMGKVVWTETGSQFWTPLLRPGKYEVVASFEGRSLKARATLARRQTRPLWVVFAFKVERAEFLRRHPLPKGRGVLSLRLEREGKPLAGWKVAVTRFGEIVAQGTTGKSGRLDLLLPAPEEYVVEFVSPDGKRFSDIVRIETNVRLKREGCPGRYWSFSTEPLKKGERAEGPKVRVKAVPSP